MRFIHLAEAVSTNQEARARALAGETGPLWITAERQSGGVGRRGRAWNSPPGNLYASGLYPACADPRDTAKLVFCAALACADTIGEYLGRSAVQIKWPNDILISGAKIAGILLETGSGPAQFNPFVIIGVGINLLSHPADTPYPATHLLAHIDPASIAGAEPLFAGAQPVAASLAAHFSRWRETYLSSGFAPIKRAWLSRAAGLGTDIIVNLPAGHKTGRFEGLYDDGALCLMTDDGAERIHAGDVFF